MDLLQLVKAVENALTDDLRRAPWKGSANEKAGHCYVACESLFHLSGKTLKPYFVRHEGSPHWFLRTQDGKIIDPTFEQFSTPVPYAKGIGKGFLTKEPSKRAQTVIDRVRGATDGKETQADFKVAGLHVDGLKVRPDVPNMASIGSSLNTYKILRGIREVPFSAFADGDTTQYYSKQERDRTLDLASQIKESGEISPLIVVIDADGPYILEGGHRFDALRELSKTSFPALVVRDLDDIEGNRTPDVALAYPAKPALMSKAHAKARQAMVDLSESKAIDKLIENENAPSQILREMKDIKYLTNNVSTFDVKKFDQYFEWASQDPGFVKTLVLSLGDYVTKLDNFTREIKLLYEVTERNIGEYFSNGFPPKSDNEIRNREELNSYYDFDTVLWPAYKEVAGYEKAIATLTEFTEMLSAAHKYSTKHRYGDGDRSKGDPWPEVSNFEKMWHVTTAFKEILSGGFKTREELGGKAAGLGGHVDGISFTASQSIAEGIELAVRDLTTIMQGPRTVETIKQWADSFDMPEDLWQTAFDGFVSAHGKIDTDPTKKLTAENAYHLFRYVLIHADSKGLRYDPLFFGDLAEMFTKVDINNVGTVEAIIDMTADGITYAAGMEEWRVPPKKGAIMSYGVVGSQKVPKADKEQKTASLLETAAKMLVRADEPDAVDREEAIDEIRRALASYMEDNYYDDHHYFWDYGNKIFTENEAYNDEILENLTGHAAGRRGIATRVEEARRLGISDETLLEAVHDYAVWASDSNELVVDLASAKDDEGRTPIDEVINGSRVINDEIVNVAKTLTEDEWNSIGGYLRRDGHINILEGTTPLFDRIELVYKRGIEIFYGFDSDRLRRFASRIDSMIDEAEENISDKIEQLDERGPSTDNIIYRVKHERFPGYYVANLPASALQNESKDMGHCVGNPEQGYIGQVHLGQTQIWSLRKPLGASLLTFEIDLMQGKPVGVDQIKGKGNRYPGFANKADQKLNKPKEVEVCVEILEHFGLRPNAVEDLLPGLTQLEQLQNEQPQQPAQQASFAQEVHCGFCRKPTKAAMLEALASVLTKRLRTE